MYIKQLLHKALKEKKKNDFSQQTHRHKMFCVISRNYNISTAKNIYKQKKREREMQKYYYSKIEFIFFSCIFGLSVEAF